MIFSTLLTTWAAPNKSLVIPEELWIKTWLGLRARGKGKVESVAVWGGSRDAKIERVEKVYFLSDSPGGVQGFGYHRASPRALENLLVQLRQDRKVIIADVHTHPNTWVGLSGLDKKNPIEFRIGVYAVVLPLFAMSEPSLASAGIHEYIGEGQWRMLSQRTKRKIFTFIKA